MRRLLIATAVCLVSPLFMGGCFGAFASNQARRQAARTADHYVREYVEPEVANDPQSRQAFRETRNDIADTIVRSGNDRYTNRVGVNDRGWLTNER